MEEPRNGRPGQSSHQVVACRGFQFQSQPALVISKFQFQIILRLVRAQHRASQASGADKVSMSSHHKCLCSESLIPHD